jgi:hypothetical protein
MQEHEQETKTWGNREQKASPIDQQLDQGWEATGFFT